MRPRLRLFIARQYQALHRLGEALASARLCVTEAPNDPALDRIADCRELVQALEPLVAPPPATPTPTPPPQPAMSTSPRVVDVGSAQSPTQHPALPSPSAGVGPWVLAGFGALSLGAAGLFGWLRSEAEDEMNAACNGQRMTCTPAAISARDRANDWTTATNVSFAIGGAAVIGGVAWWLAGRASSNPGVPRSLHFEVTPRASGVMFGLGGLL